MAQLVYSFNEGNKNMRAQLGGKGANLSEMTQIGLPVPFGFIVDSSVCTSYDWENAEFPKELQEQIEDKLEELAHVTGKTYGSKDNPLFLAVRSSAQEFMPGMMDSILNIGINDETFKSLLGQAEDPNSAHDTYDKLKERFCHVTCEEFTQDINAQLHSAIRAVFRSWNSKRAVMYRHLHDIPDLPGTAVVVQTMVFGNLDKNSGAGVVFSKNPINGNDELYGEYMQGIQGDVIASGVKNPYDFELMKGKNEKLYENMQRIAKLLEEHFKWVQNIEFTYEQGKLYIIQSKNAKLTFDATVKNAVEMQGKGYFDKSSAIMQISRTQLRSLIKSSYEMKEKGEEDLIASGESASVSVAVGRLCVSVDSARSMIRQGERVIFACDRACPELFEILNLAEGLLVCGGGSTSNMAVIARSLDKPFIIIRENLAVDTENGTIMFKEQTLREGEILTLDSKSASVYKGEKERIQAKFCNEFEDMLSWADEKRKLKVRANISNADEVQKAVEFGAEGVGLCRTEHIFDEIHINDMLTLLLSDMEAERRLATEKLIVVQKNFLRKVFAIMKDMPVTIRLMDPLLNDWLPKTDAEIEKTADRLSIPLVKLKERLKNIVEINPLLGYRGCRITVKYPEITTMQVMAIALAVLEVKQEYEITIVPEIMIPLVGISKEFQFVKKLVTDVIKECEKEFDEEIEYSIGTMIEVPRSTLIAADIAKDADFFSFGTNDLTQLSFGISKENVEILMNKYKEADILEYNPFETLDMEGVGALISRATESARTVKSKIKLGICGNQSSDPATIGFCNKLGLNYISCEPEKIAEARIAAAQAEIIQN